MGADCVDFIDQIFERSDSVFAEAFLNKFVVGQRNSLLVDLSVSSFVDKLFDVFARGISKLQSQVPESNVWLNSSEEID